MEEHKEKCEEEKCGEECGSGKVTTEQLIEHNHFILNVLIELLIEKKVISEEELKSKVEEIQKKFAKPKE